MGVGTRKAMVKHLVSVGVGIPHEVDDLRLAIKREIFTRGLCCGDIARRLGITEAHVQHVLRPTSPYRMNPGLLNRMIEAIHITPAVARRLHLLAARDAGWKV